MLRYKLFKVREGKLEILKAWAEELRGRSSEISDTLAFENVGEETLHLFAVGDSWFVMAMQALTGPHKKADMTVELNKKHMAVLAECLAPYEGETLYSFSRS